VIVMPYLLGHGKHATLELDEVLDELRAEIPQIQLYLADGLGADSRLADLVVERVRDLDGSAPPAPRAGRPAGILLVKAGTKTQYDDCLWLEELGQMVEKGLGLGYAVAVAQSHYGDPTMEAAAAHLVEERKVSSIICVPYLFFPGMILRRNVLGGMERLQQKYPDVPMLATPPLGVDDRLVAVAADRVREVWDREDGRQMTKVQPK
jgi:sirohydrochlorin ferrochelatase